MNILPAEMPFTNIPGLTLHHIGYAVPDISQAIKIFNWLGFQEKSTCIDEKRGIRISFVRNKQGMLVELIAPFNDKNPVSGFLKRMGGGGPYHFCFSTSEDATKIEKLMKGNGMTLLKKRERAIALANREVEFFYSRAIGIIEILYDN